MKRLVLGIILLSNVVIANDWYVTVIQGENNVIECSINNTANPNGFKDISEKIGDGMYVVHFDFNLYVASSKSKCEELRVKLKRKLAK